MRCPRGHLNVLPFTFSDVQVTGFGMKIAVDCVVCGVQFDAAPGESVRIDTEPDGSLTVRQIVAGLAGARRAFADLTPDELVAVRVALDEVAAGRADEAAVAGVSEKVNAWMVANPAVAAALITTFGGALTAILVALLNLWATQGQEPTRPAPAPPPEVVILDHYPTDQELEDLAEREVQRVHEEGSERSR